MKIFIIAVQTADGFISGNVAHTPLSWRSGADRDFFIKKTKEAGAVIMGANTFHSMRRPMPGRLHFVYSNEPIDNPEVRVVTKDPKELLSDIEKLGYSEVAICGGATIYTMFMEAGLVDKIYLTVEPVLFGRGLNLFNKDLYKKLKLSSFEKLGENTLLLEYDVIKEV